MFSLLLCELNVKLDGLTGLVQLYYITAGIFLKSIQAVYLTSFSLTRQSESFKEILEKILPL